MSGDADMDICPTSTRHFGLLAIAFDDYNLGKHGAIMCVFLHSLYCHPHATT